MAAGQPTVAYRRTDGMGPETTVRDDHGGLGAVASGILGPQQGPGIFGTMLVSEPNGGYGTYFGPGLLVISARSRESHHSETSCRMHAFAYLEAM